MPKHYENEAEIEDVVQGFENCTTGKGEFTHREHLTVAVWYLRKSDEHQQALDSMRAGLLRFLNHHGIERVKYKEDLTVAWMKLVETTLAELDSELSLLDTTNIVLDRLGDSGLIISGASERG